MKILVTGGTGLVGSELQRLTASKYIQADMIFSSSKSCNLLDHDQTKKYVLDIKPDVVIHLAANVGGLFKNMSRKVQMFEDNLKMNINIVSACHAAGVNKFIGTLSTCIFPDDITYPINENMLHSGPPHVSNDAYAYAKRMLDTQCRAYNEQYNTNYSCIIPTNIYGPNDNYNLDDAHVIPALIHKCYLAKKAGKPFVVSGTGKPLRQFIHAKDLAIIVLQLIDKINRENLIVSSSEENSIGQIATYVARSFDYEDMIEFDETKPDGQFKKTADNTKLKSLIPNYSFINIQTGINEVVEYFINNYSNVRK